MKKAAWGVLVMWVVAGLIGWYGTKAALAYMAWADHVWGEWGRFYTGLTTIGLWAVAWVGWKILDKLTDPPADQFESLDVDSFVRRLLGQLETHETGRGWRPCSEPDETGIVSGPRPQSKSR